MPQRLAGLGFELQAKGAAQALHRFQATDALALRAVADTPGLALPARQVLAVVQQQRVAEQLLRGVFQHLLDLPGGCFDHRCRVATGEADQVFSGNGRPCRQRVVITQARQQHRHAAVVGQGLMQQPVPAAASGVAAPQRLGRAGQRLIEPGRVAGALLAQFCLQCPDTLLSGGRQLLLKGREETPLELPQPGHALAAQAEGTAAPATGEQHRHAAAAGLAGLDRRRPQVLAAGAQQHIDLRHPLGQPQARPGTDIGQGHHQVSLASGLFEHRLQ